MAQETLVELFRADMQELREQLAAERDYRDRMATDDALEELDGELSRYIRSGARRLAGTTQSKARAERKDWDDWAGFMGDRQARQQAQQDALKAMRAEVREAMAERKRQDRATTRAMRKLRKELA